MNIFFYFDFFKIPEQISAMIDAGTEQKIIVKTFEKIPVTTVKDEIRRQKLSKNREDFGNEILWK